MPKAFDKCVKSGAKVRTVTEGDNKGKLICLGKKHPVLGRKRGK